MAVTRGEKFGFTLPAPTPHRPYGMDDVTRGQKIAAGDARFAGRAAAEAPAFVEQFGSRRPVDRTIDATATQQRAVRGIDDRVDA